MYVVVCCMLYGVVVVVVVVCSFCMLLLYVVDVASVVATVVVVMLLLLPLLLLLHMLLLMMINEVSPRLRWENKCFSFYCISIDWTHLREIEIGMYKNGNISAIAVLGCGCQSSRKMDRLY